MARKRNLDENAFKLLHEFDKLLHDGMAAVSTAWSTSQRPDFMGQSRLQLQV